MCLLLRLIASRLYIDTHTHFSLSPFKTMSSTNTSNSKLEYHRTHSSFFFLSTFVTPFSDRDKIGFHYLQYIAPYLLIPPVCNQLPSPAGCLLGIHFTDPTGPGYRKWRKETNKPEKRNQSIFFVEKKEREKRKRNRKQLRLFQFSRLASYQYKFASCSYKV